MEISNLKRIEQKKINGSDNIRYSAVLNGNTLVMYETDGFFLPHLTLQEWNEYVIKNCL